MKKLLYKLCLCGVLICSINYELAYSTSPEDQHPAVDNIPYLEDQPFTSQILLNNNQITGTLDNNITIQGSNNIIGQYDTSKYEIKNNILYEKDKVFCELNPNAGTYKIFNMNCSYTAQMQYNNGDGEKNYYVFPICDNYYTFMNDRGLHLINNKDSEMLFIGDLGISFWGKSIPYVDDIVTTTVYDKYNIMCIKIGDIYKLSEEGTKILYNVPLYKYDQTDQKWYEIGKDGNYIIKESTEDEKIELSKSKLIIPSQYKLTLSESEGGGAYFFRSK